MRENTYTHSHPVTEVEAITRENIRNLYDKRYMSLTYKKLLNVNKKVQHPNRQTGKERKEANHTHTTNG